MNVRTPSRADLGPLPTADDVARALVAAASITGELERLRKAATEGTPLNAVPLRARWPALEAMRQLWPKAGWSRLGAAVGCASGASAQLGMGGARRSARWRAADVFAVMAAI